MKTIYSCHSHVFTNMSAPNNFLFNEGMPVIGWIPGLTKLLFRRNFSKGLGKFMHNLFSFSSDDVFDRYAAMLNIGNDRSSEDIFNLMRGYYPEGTVFVVYSMDMHFMKAGKCRQSYKEQLDELAALKKKYPALIKPFIMLDPRRGKQEIEALAKEYIENRGFCGIKVYPLLGYYPYDDRLSGVYDYAQKNGIPVTGHCAGGPVFYRKKLTPDMIDLNAPVKPSDFKNPCYHYSHPKCFEKVAEKYPRLRLNLAHFGGGEQLDNYLGISWEHPDEKSSNWFVQVKRVMKKNKNVYSDVSGGFQQSRYLPVLKLAMLDSRISGRILYGSDFYMEQIDMTEREFSVEARAMLGEKDFFRIANENALKFLG